jgi:hypothetical protein
MLAPGEHVLTAGEVDAIGGQAAMFRLRDAIRSGTVPRYAAGGTIPRYARTRGIGCSERWAVRR